MGDVKLSDFSKEQQEVQTALQVALDDLAGKGKGRDLLKVGKLNGHTAYTMQLGGKYRKEDLIKVLIKANEASTRILFKKDPKTKQLIKDTAVEAQIQLRTRLIQQIRVSKEDLTKWQKRADAFKSGAKWIANKFGMHFGLGVFGAGCVYLFGLATGGLGFAVVAGSVALYKGVKALGRRQGLWDMPDYIRRGILKCRHSLSLESTEPFAVRYNLQIKKIKERNHYDPTHPNGFTNEKDRLAFLKDKEMFDRGLGIYTKANKSLLSKALRNSIENPTKLKDAKFIIEHGFFEKVTTSTLEKFGNTLYLTETEKREMLALMFDKCSRPQDMNKIINYLYRTGRGDLATELIAKGAGVKKDINGKWENHPEIRFEDDTKRTHCRRLVAQTGDFELLNKVFATNIPTDPVEREKLFTDPAYAKKLNDEIAKVLDDPALKELPNGDNIVFAATRKDSAENADMAEFFSRAIQKNLRSKLPSRGIEAFKKLRSMTPPINKDDLYKLKTELQGLAAALRGIGYKDSAFETSLETLIEECMIAGDPEKIFKRFSKIMKSSLFDPYAKKIKMDGFKKLKNWSNAMYVDRPRHNFGPQMCMRLNKINKTKDFTRIGGWYNILKRRGFSGASAAMANSKIPNDMVAAGAMLIQPNMGMVASVGSSVGPMLLLIPLFGVAGMAIHNAYLRHDARAKDMAKIPEEYRDRMFYENILGEPYPEKPKPDGQVITAHPQQRETTVSLSISLEDLAKEYGTTVNEIKKVNPDLGTKNEIREGQKIVIPHKQEEISQTTSLKDLAAKHDTTEAAIRAANDFKDDITSIDVVPGFSRQIKIPRKSPIITELQKNLDTAEKNIKNISGPGKEKRKLEIREDALRKAIARRDLGAMQVILRGDQDCKLRISKSMIKNFNEIMDFEYFGKDIQKELISQLAVRCQSSQRMFQLFDQQLDYLGDTQLTKEIINEHFDQMLAPSLAPADAKPTPILASEPKTEVTGSDSRVKQKLGLADDFAVRKDVIVGTREVEAEERLTKQQQFKALMLTASRMGDEELIKKGLEIAKKEGISLLDIRDEDENTLVMVARTSKNVRAILMIAHAMEEEMEYGEKVFERTRFISLFGHKFAIGTKTQEVPNIYSIQNKDNKTFHDLIDSDLANQLDEALGLNPFVKGSFTYAQLEKHYGEEAHLIAELACLAGVKAPINIFLDPMTPHLAAMAAAKVGGGLGGYFSASGAVALFSTGVMAGGFAGAYLLSLGVLWGVIKHIRDQDQLRHHLSQMSGGVTTFSVDGQGMTLAELAEAHGTTVEDILKANPNKLADKTADFRVPANTRINIRNPIAKEMQRARYEYALLSPQEKEEAQKKAIENMKKTTAPFTKEEAQEFTVTVSGAIDDFTKQIQGKVKDPDTFRDLQEGLEKLQGELDKCINTNTSPIHAFEKLDARFAELFAKCELSAEDTKTMQELYTDAVANKVGQKMLERSIENAEKALAALKAQEAESASPTIDPTLDDSETSMLTLDLAEVFSKVQADLDRKINKGLRRIEEGEVTPAGKDVTDSVQDQKLNKLKQGFAEIQNYINEITFEVVKGEGAKGKELAIEVQRRILKLYRDCELSIPDINKLKMSNGDSYAKMILDQIHVANLKADARLSGLEPPKSSVAHRYLSLGKLSRDIAALRAEVGSSKPASFDKDTGRPLKEDGDTPMPERYVSEKFIHAYNRLNELGQSLKKVPVEERQDLEKAIIKQKKKLDKIAHAMVDLHRDERALLAPLGQKPTDWNTFIAHFGVAKEQDEKGAIQRLAFCLRRLQMKVIMDLEKGETLTPQQKKELGENIKIIGNVRKLVKIIPQPRLLTEKDPLEHAISHGTKLGRERDEFLKAIADHDGSTIDEAYDALMGKFKASDFGVEPTSRLPGKKVAGEVVSEGPARLVPHRKQSEMAERVEADRTLASLEPKKAATIVARKYPPEVKKEATQLAQHLKKAKADKAQRIRYPTENLVEAYKIYSELVKNRPFQGTEKEISDIEDLMKDFIQTARSMCGSGPHERALLDKMYKLKDNERELDEFLGGEFMKHFVPRAQVHGIREHLERLTPDDASEAFPLSLAPPQQIGPRFGGENIFMDENWFQDKPSDLEAADTRIHRGPLEKTPITGVRTPETIKDAIPRMMELLGRLQMQVVCGLVTGEEAEKVKVAIKKLQAALTDKNKFKKVFGGDSTTFDLLQGRDAIPGKKTLDAEYALIKDKPQQTAQATTKPDQPSQTAKKPPITKELFSKMNHFLTRVEFSDEVPREVGKLYEDLKDSLKILLRQLYSQAKANQVPHPTKELEIAKKLMKKIEAAEAEVTDADFEKFRKLESIYSIVSVEMNKARDKSPKAKAPTGRT